MAQAHNGILGGFSGKVGTVSGYTRYGRSIMRSAVSRVNDKATPLRLAQREKIKVCNLFMKAFTGTGFFSKTFPNYGHGGSGYNRAMGVLLNKAIYGSYPGFSIDYKKVLISTGPLPEAAAPAVTLQAVSDLYFTWADNSNDGTAKRNDKVILLAYFPAMQVILFSVGAATRAQGQAVLPVPGMQGQPAETWIGFLSNDERVAANSVYTGLVQL